MWTLADPSLVKVSKQKSARQIIHPQYSYAWLGRTNQGKASSWAWITNQPFEKLKDCYTDGGKNENFLNLRIASGTLEDFPITGENTGTQFFIFEGNKL